MMLLVSGAPLYTQCKIPSDMSIHYETLTAATIGNKFLIPTEYISSSVNQTLHRGEKMYQDITNKRQDEGSIQFPLVYQSDHRFYTVPISSIGDCVVVVIVLDLTECTTVNMFTQKCCSFNVRLCV